MLVDCEGTTSFGRVLWMLRSVFTAPTFVTFCALATGMVLQVGERTVCGMLVASGMSRAWHHSVAHKFFSQAAWSLDRLGLAVCDLALRHLVDPMSPIVAVVDDSLFLRSGRKVAHAFWQHDGSATGAKPVGFGNCFVVLCLVVRLPMVTRPVCLPILFRLRGKGGASCPELARELVDLLARHLPGRRVELVGDCAYASKAMAGLPERVIVTSRLRKNAALYRLKPPPTGKRGRPREKGARLGSLAEIARDRRRRWHDVTVTRYGTTQTVRAITFVCLWYSVFKSQPVRVVLVQEPGASNEFSIALITTDLNATSELVIARYAQRWAIEVCFADAKQITGVGQARNRTPRAVQRTVPFGMLVQSLTAIWYALNGQPVQDIARRRYQAPWYGQKTEPSTLDMHTALRRQILASQYRQGPHRNRHTQQIRHPAPAPDTAAA